MPCAFTRLPFLLLLVPLFLVVVAVAVGGGVLCVFRGGIGGRNLKVAPEILCQVVIKLIEQRGGSIESRDLGRELNRISVDEDGTTALSVIKEVRQVKTQFLTYVSYEAGVLGRRLRAQDEDAVLRK